MKHYPQATTIRALAHPEGGWVVVVGIRREGCWQRRATDLGALHAALDDAARFRRAKLAERAEALLRSRRVRRIHAAHL